MLHVSPCVAERRRPTGLGSLLGALFAVFALAAFLSMPLSRAYAAGISVPGQVIAGANQVETSVVQSQAAFNSSQYAIVVGVLGWADALSAAGLAGALDCPILYTEAASLSYQTAGELQRLGVSQAIIVGGTAVVSAQAEYDLMALGISVTRLAGTTAADTQLELFYYGLSGNLWGSDFLFVASGATAADAICAAPIAFSHASPIFLTGADGTLTDNQQLALIDWLLNSGGAPFNECVIAGGKAVVSERTEGFLQALVSDATGQMGHCSRVAGETLYDTSAQMAQWAVDNAGARWDKAAFMTASDFCAALSGAPLQGKDDSVILLLCATDSPAVRAACAAGGYMGGFRMFGTAGTGYFAGGTSYLPQSFERYLEYSLAAGAPLPMGSSLLKDGVTLVWCNALGVYDQANVGKYLAQANYYASATPWLILVDVTDHLTVVLSGYQGNWHVEKVWTCTTGAPWSPTVQGVFTVGIKGLCFGHGYTCWYYTQFCGDYLFHSVKYEEGSITEIQDGRLGVDASEGCVRLDIANAKWIYDTIPEDTTVVVYEHY